MNGCTASYLFKLSVGWASHQDHAMHVLLHHPGE